MVVSMSVKGSISYSSLLPVLFWKAVFRWTVSLGTKSVAECANWPCWSAQSIWGHVLLPFKLGECMLSNWGHRLDSGMKYSRKYGTDWVYLLLLEYLQKVGPYWAIFLSQQPLTIVSRRFTPPKTNQKVWKLNPNKDWRDYRNVSAPDDMNDIIVPLCRLDFFV